MQHLFDLEKIVPVTPRTLGDVRELVQTDVIVVRGESEFVEKMVRKGKNAHRVHADGRASRRSMGLATDFSVYNPQPERLPQFVRDLEPDMVAVTASGIIVRGNERLGHQAIGSPIYRIKGLFCEAASINLGPFTPTPKPGPVLRAGSDLPPLYELEGGAA